jgi:hypothetical protein
MVTASGDGFEVLMNARKALSSFALDPGFKIGKVSLNGAAAAESSDLSVAGNLVSLSLGTTEGPAAFANFNLEYVPFGLTGNPGWSDYSGQSAFNLTGDGPVWIIRNGVNDQVQNSGTDYTNVDGSGKNGNGGVKYTVLASDADYDNDGIKNKDELKWGLDPVVANSGDTDGDGFSDALEVANGFDPRSGADDPVSAPPGTLAVTQGKVGTRSQTQTTVQFTTGGYNGTANGYYQVVSKGTEPGPLTGYIPFGSLGLGSQTKAITLPVGGAWDAAYDVYVVIMKDRSVSVPVCISLPASVETDITTGWDF